MRVYGKTIDTMAKTATTLSLIILLLSLSVPLFTYWQSSMWKEWMRNTHAYLSNGIHLDAVKQDILAVIQEDMERRGDGTSLIGTFVRLSWHCSGTYDNSDKTGGSQGGRIRFSPEKKWDANAGLDIPMKALEPVKDLHPSLTYADLYTFSGVVAAEYAGSHHVSYRLGRVDHQDGSTSPEDGRLPDADKGSPEKTAHHMRDVFYRMGFTDKEMVCLMGAHTLGRCHIDRSGYWG
jgi:cytochrome c peroxidase